MTSISGDNKFPKMALPLGKVRLPIFFYKIIIVLSVLVLVVIGLNLYLQNQKKITANKKTISAPLALNLEVAKKTLSCIDKSRDDRGAYYIVKNSKYGIIKSNSTGIMALWAKYNFDNPLLDSSWKESFNKEMDLYLDKDKVVVIQTDFWARKLLFDMYKNNKFDDNDKKKIKDLASRVSDGEKEIILKIKDKIKTDNYEDIDSLTFFDSQDKIDYIKMDESTLNIAMMYASDFLSWYQFSNDENDLKIAKALYLESYKTFMLSKPSLISKSIMAIVSMDFYNYTKGNEYLNFAKKVVDDIKFPNVCYSGDDCYPDIYTEYLVSELANSYKLNIDKNFNIIDLKNRIVDSLVKNNLDMVSYPRYINGDGCLTYSSEGDEKNIDLNSLLVGSLMRN